ncbi:hypothetical protein BU16DRAFT_94338 [Lophium mytilinum]|uniref:Heterokaryon incompatibility domain-containing protein n=1 Tax=Lophium mytilinum TaxID=390894 RepID=A0A6A6QMI0_9PEZI|nr:hypothetical protein BU16DRAFT_94338 [Lophium mytilinum]
MFRRRGDDAEKGTFINPAERPESDENHESYGPKREIPLKGYLHIFSSQSSIQFKHPHFYKPSQWVYGGATTYRNKDSMLRYREGKLDDRYISPFNGRTEKLTVQAVDTIYDDSSSHATWNRTFVRNISPFHLRIANWPASHIPYDAEKVTKTQLALLCLKYLPAAMALVLVIGFPGNVEGEVRNGGRYDCFPYKFHGYSKVARNMLEEKAAKKHTDHAPQKTNPVSNRLLHPRYLCVIRDLASPTLGEVDRVSVDDWIAENQSNKGPLPYLFISYFTGQFPSESQSHCQLLIDIAEKAARAEGLSAFWIGCSCMPDSDQLQDDIFRLSDVIRGAKAVAIIVGPHADHDPRMPLPTRDIMLRQWGERLWTFPEVLLSPARKPIVVYTADDLDDHSSPLILEKNQLAPLVWKDQNASRQLIDHYEGNLILSRLELVTLGLQCLYSRQHGKYMQGDHSYALMGLLRVRPEVDQTDSDFQAFARLSLANDSDLLLERLACILPKNPTQAWHNMDDAYEVNLWDIYPTCQIAGIGEDNTIIVDGARGANVRWKSFASVNVRRRWSWTRLLVRLMLHTASLAVLIGGVMLWIAHRLKKDEHWIADHYTIPWGVTTDSRERRTFELVQYIVRLIIDDRVIKGWGIVFVLYSVPMLFVAPKLIHTLYGGKLWNTQPWLFGFEGYLPIDQIEFLIFGDRKGRLRWHPFGSPLSRHEVDDEYEDGHCIAVDPTTHADVRDLVERAQKSQLGEQKIFTLVDTNTMTVTLFEAARPPICFLLLGSEGGMQRAVGCSYDWTSGTLYRETVLRMETSCKDKMDLVSRARISLEKKTKGPKPSPAPPKPKGIRRRSGKPSPPSLSMARTL